MKLSKSETKEHEKAVALVKSDHKLCLEERLFVAEYWNPMAEHNIGKTASFFTPMGLARELQIESLTKPGKRVLDLCAGTGRLALFSWLSMLASGENHGEIVCIEFNPAFIAVGKRVLPEAIWIRADAFEANTYKNLGTFDEVISNPPFGLFPKTGWLFNTLSQYMAAEVAMKIAGHAVFILPQNDCPFSFSGSQCYTTKEPKKYLKFQEETGVTFGMNCGIDTKLYESQWNGTRMRTEIVIISRPQEKQGLAKSFEQVKTPIIEQHNHKAEQMAMFA